MSDLQLGRESACKCFTNNWLAHTSVGNLIFSEDALFAILVTVAPSISMKLRIEWFVEGTVQKRLQRKKLLLLINTRLERMF